MIRAFYRAMRIAGANAPYDTLIAKIFYPAQLSGDRAERNLGVVHADATLAPFPVALFCNGVNGPPEVYQWLAMELALRGYVMVTYAWVTDTLPGGVPGLTPGVELDLLTPEKYGTGPTCQALPVLLEDLAQVNAAGPLAGLLDLSRVILGGHSAGGSAALLNANRRFFPSLVAAFSYGAHTQAATNLGHAPGSVFRLADDVPLLIMGGNRDGVIAASSGRYREAGEVEDKAAQLAQLERDATAPFLRTFHEAIGGTSGSRYLAILHGANHFSLAYPPDMTTGRPYLDQPATRPGEAIRALLVELIVDFLEAYVKQKTEAAQSLAQKFTPAEKRLAVALRK